MGARVVVLEDDQPLRRVFVRGLEAAGFEVEQTTSARDVLKEIAAGKLFDLIVLEIDLQQMEGLGFLRAVQAVAPDQLPRIVVVASAHSGPVWEITADLTTHPALCKPFELAELIERARSVIDALGRVEE